MTDFDPGPCRWCGRPEEDHGARYMALIGSHQWAPMRRSGNQDSRVVDHPDGGVTMHAVETPSDRLPPHPQSAYERVNELVQQTPEQFRETAEAAKALGSQLNCTKCGHGMDEHHQAGCRHLTPTHHFLRVRCSCRVNLDRPGIIRRILGATRRSNT